MTKKQKSPSCNLLRVSKKWQNFRYDTAITTFSGIQKYRFVGEITTFGNNLYRNILMKVDNQNEEGGGKLSRIF